jgi:hypothetical protein
MEAQQGQQAMEPHGQLPPTALPGASKPSSMVNGAATAATPPVAA